MNPDPLLELAPLAALDALDGEDRAAFAVHSVSCVRCRSELQSHQAVAARIGQAALAVRPSRHLRPRLLARLGPTGTAAGPDPGAIQASSRSSAGPLRRRAPAAFPALAAAAAVVLGVLVITTRAEREKAIREAERARQAEKAAGEREAALRRQWRELAARHLALGTLLADPHMRVTELMGLEAAPAARGRVVWNPSGREALLAAAGLAEAPAGRAYQVWVIARSEPVPAGVFHVDADGHALHSLPVLDETADAKTFAVTLEPAAGVPAPTGPMVLAGPVS